MSLTALRGKSRPYQTSEMLLSMRSDIYRYLETESIQGRHSRSLRIAQPCGTVFIEDIQLLDHHFSGWKASEIPESTPIVAVVEEGYPVSVCFCARRSNAAAEAGLETAVAFRGRGLGPRVAAAWALAIRASGRIPLYSTSWSNDASLAVARKMGLEAYASNWSIS